MTTNTELQASGAQFQEGRRADRHKVLGTLILGYALLSCGALLSVAHGWAGVLNGVLWSVYALGGFGYVLGKRWGRALTLLAAGATLASLLLLRSSAEFELAYFSTVWDFGGLPALVLLVSALLVKVPATTEAVGEPQGRERATKRMHPGKQKHRDIAYVSFLTLGLISGWAAFIAYVCRNDDIPAALGFGVFVPFLLPMMVAMVLGAGLALFLRDLRLVAMTALSIVLVTTIELFEEQIWWLPLALHSAACLTLGLVWFTRTRKKCGVEATPRRLAKDEAEHRAGAANR